MVAGFRVSPVTAVKVAASGLFDEAFYRSQTSDLGGLPPLLHYLALGWTRGLNPHPMFDVAWYLEHYPDVAGAGVEPLHHYLTSGCWEGRDPSAWFSSEEYLRARPHLRHQRVCPLVHFAATAGAQTKEGEEPVSVLPGGRGEVAVALHIFYPDFIPIFADVLRRLPRSVDAFVSVPDRAVAQEAQEWFSSIPQVRDLDVRVVPNRGRNFGPLLVEFADALQAYDVFGHFHSKKSLYSGQEQTAWVDHILATLAGPPTQTEMILQSLDRTTEGPYGLAYPVTPPGVPYWANHWLQNHRLGVSLTPQGLPPPTDGFLGYPVGGMFWARVEALRPLLARGWKYDDFPVEAGQTDGTTQHAIERLVSHVPTALGFRSLVLEPGSPHPREPLSDVVVAYSRLRPELLAPMVHHRRGLVTFDLFETLVQRGTGFVEWGKMSLGRRLATSGVVRSPGDFVLLRNAAEARLAERAEGRWDAHLDDIYEQLAAMLPVPVDPRSLAETEFLDDLGCLQLRRRVPDWFRERVAEGLPTAVVSDTYYEGHRLQRILETLGLPSAQAVTVMASADLGRRKDRGDMWDAVMELAGTVGDGSLLHVGDNVRSDVQAVVDRGEHALHVLNPSDLWFLTQGERWQPGTDVDGEAEYTGTLIAETGRDPFLSEYTRV